MEEIIKQTLTAIPQYLINFINLLSAPKQFPLDKLSNDLNKTKDSLTEALKFILISYSLVIILGSHKVDTTNAIKSLSVFAVSTLIKMSLFVFAIFLAWRIFGSKRPFLDYFIVYSYHIGVAFIILAIFALISEGYLKTTNKELYDNILKVKAGNIEFNANWLHDLNYKIHFAIFVFGFIISIIWFYAGWGAYRVINGTKKLKSLVVLLLTGIFSWIVIALDYLITKGITK